MAKIMRDVMDVQCVGANLRAPATQTTSDKKQIIEECKQRITEMKKLLATEAKMSISDVTHLLANEQDMAKFLETATPKAKRIVDIIDSNKGLIVSAEQAIEVFKRHQARQKADMDRMSRINNQH